MSKERILIAEDEEGIRDFVSRGLSDFGYEVATANDGLQAWEMLTNSTFDLVVLDIRMPGLNGLDLCRKLRQHQGYATPVLMLTALNTTALQVHGVAGSHRGLAPAG